MSSFLDKLNTKLRVPEAGATQGGMSPGPIQGNVNGVTVASSAPLSATANSAPALEVKAAPESDEPPFDVDIFQSETRLVIFAQAGGMAPEDIDITLDEEAHTLVIRGIQKRPEAPAMRGAVEADRGKFIKQECSWRSYYRKVFLSASVDADNAESFFQRGVLIISLPIKKVGEGKKLKVEETPSAPRI